jgi:hypothetical protein
MSKLNTDVAVVGAELCGLAAAAIIAHGGRRVVVIDDGEHLDTLPLGDRMAPVAPTLWRLPTSGPAALVLDSLGLKQDARRVFGEPLGLGIIDDPDVRMIVPIDPTSRMVELRRVFGDEGEALGKLLDDFPADGRHKLLSEAGLLHQEGFFEKRRARKRQQALGPAGFVEEADPLVEAFGTERLAAVLPLLAPFVQGIATPSPAGLAGHLALLQLAQGVHAQAKGGTSIRAALRELLLTVIRGHGGDVVKQRVATVQVDGKNISALETAGANSYAARLVIDATARRDLTERLPPSRRREKTLEMERAVQPAGDAAIVRWLVPVASLPRGLPPLSLVVAATPSGAPGLMGVFAGLAPRDKGGVDDSVVAVVLAATCALDEGEAAASALEQRLDDLFPFARDAVRAADRIVGPDARAALPRWVTIDGGQHLLNGRRPSTAFANLVRAGRDLVPTLGIDGELAAARSVVAVAQQALGAARSRSAEAA